MNTLKKIVVIVTVGALNSGTTLAGGEIPTLTQEYKTFAIESLRTYEESVESGEVTPPAQASAQKVAPFECIDEHEQSCKTQEWLYHDHIAASAPEPAMYADGKYRVSVTFKSDTPHPLRYNRAGKFESIPEVEQTAVENQIFEQHLGLNYSLYNPELIGSSSSGATIEIWVTSSDELLPFVDDPSIQGIFHINNSEVHEGYNADGYETLKVEY